MTRRLITMVALLIAFSYSIAQADTFPCPDLMYEELRVLEVEGYRIVERGLPDYRIIIVEVEHPDGTRWCFDTPRLESVVIGSGDVSDPVDMNGNGIPDLFVQVYGISKGCDESAYIIELAPEPSFVYQAESASYKDRGNLYDVCAHWAQDVDHDGVYELLTYEKYYNCNEAESPYVPVVMIYRQAQGYIETDPYADEPVFTPNHLRFVYEDQIGRALAYYVTTLRADSAQRLAREHRCSMLPILLPMVFQGNAELARATLDALYLLDDKQDVWDDVVRAVSRSEYISPPW